jgi:hypothetical protein
MAFRKSGGNLHGKPWMEIFATDSLIVHETILKNHPAKQKTP